MNIQIFYYLGAIVFGQSLTLLVFFLYINSFSPSVYAVIGLFETALLLLQSVIGGALDRAAQRFYIDFNPSRVISTASSTAIVFGLILFPFISLALLILENLTLFDLLAIYFAALSYVLHAIVLVKYQFSNQPRKYFIFSVLKPLVMLIFVIYFLFLDYSGKEIFILSCYFSGFSIMALSLYITKPYNSGFSQIKLAKEMLAFSLPFLPTLVSAWIINWSSRFFMAGNIDLEAIGIFSAAQRIAMLFFIFSQALIIVATPRIFNLLKDKRIKDAQIEMILYIKVLAFLSITIIFFFPPIFNYFTPEKYIGIESFLMILISINFISACMGVTTNLLFSFYKKTLLQMICFLFIAFLSILMNVVLIPVYYMEGAFASLIIAVVLLFIAHNLLVRKFARDNVPSAKIILILGIFLAMLVLHQLFINANTNLFLKTSFELSCVFFFILLARNAFIEINPNLNSKN